MMLLLISQAFAHDHHVVRNGDTLTTVAEMAEIDPEALARLNQLVPGAELVPGTVLLLPGSAEVRATVLARSGELRSDHPLEVGEAIEAGTVVCTGPSSYATLRLAAATETHAHDELTLLADTCVTVDATSQTRLRHRSLVSVRSGSVSVRPETGGGGLTVRTADGVTTGQDGGFRVSVEAAATRTEAVEGAASVIGRAGEVALTEGQGTRVRQGEAPAAASALLVAPVAVSPAPKAALRRPEFTWSPVDRALGYRVEIASDSGFSDIVCAEDVGSLRWLPERLFLPSGPVWWRVSAFDRTGFVGLPSPGWGITPPVELLP